MSASGGPSVPDRLAELERLSRGLDPGPAGREALREAVIAYTERFLESLGSSAVWNGDTEQGRESLEGPFDESPSSIEQLLAIVEHGVDGPGLNPAGGRFFGYIPGGGLYPSALGDFLAAIANRYAGFAAANPGATRLENSLVRWLARVAGYPQDAGGTLLSGGSIANLTAIVTARDAAGLRGRDFERSPVYLTAHTHHSVAKALRIAGLAECPVRTVAMDGHYRMDADDLERRVEADRAGGMNPWLVVSTAGTTNVGAVDPLDSIAGIAARHGLWHHVDGAYGALFALVESARPRLLGLERSDSLVLDPHKTLFLPYGTGAVLVKDRAALLRSHQYSADYMEGSRGATLDASPADMSPELTRHFRGMRLWLPLKLFGVAAFRAALEEKLLLARYFRDRLAAVDGFEVAPEPDLSVTWFRYLPSRGDPDAFNRRMLDALLADGRVFFSSTTLDDHFVIRVAVLSFRTHLADIETALDAVCRTAARLAEGKEHP